MERLQKYMSQCGIASRRKCEEIILEGRVKVNGIIINEMGCKIDPCADSVEVDDILITLEENKIYIILNKPVGFVSTVKDEKGRKTIMDLVQVNERIYPVGRLDYDSSGLILMTNDGEIYNKIIHPRVEIDKVYIAIIKGIPDSDDILKFCSGVDIGDYITSQASMEIIEKSSLNSKVKITIHEGKNRQIRKMCDAIGHEVLELKRISIGDIKIDNLPEGKWRFLNEREILYLKSL